MEKSSIGQKRLDEIIQFIGEGIIYQEAGGELKLFNQSAQRIFGLTEDEAYGRTSVSHEWHLVYEDGSPCPGEDHPSMVTLRTGQALSDQIRGIARPEQPITWISINTRPIIRPGQDSPVAVIISFTDITERKKAEEIQQRSYYRQKIAMDLAKLVNWEYDVGTDIFTFDERFYSLYGTSISEQGGNQMTSAEYAKRFLPPEEIPLVAQEIEAALEATDPNFTRQIEHRIIRADGKERYISVRFGIVKDESGRTIKTIGANQDITDRKQTEQELLNIFNLSLDLICIADINSQTFLKVNPAFTKTLGYPQHEFVNKRFVEFIHPDDVEPTNAVVEQQLRQGKEVINFENRHRCKDGSYRWLSWVSHPMPGEGKTFAVARDITEWKKANQQLEHNKLLLDATSRLARVGGWELDALTGEVSWTDETYRIHELPLDYKPPLEEAINYFHPDERDKLTAAIKDALDKAEPYDFELRFITAKGNHLWTRTSCEPQWEDGRVVRLRGVFQDITERKRAELELRQSEERNRKIIMTAIDGFWRMDHNGKLIEVNQAYCRMSGYEAKELLSMSVFDIENIETPQEIAERIQNLMKRGELRFESQHRRKDGSLFYVEISAKSGQGQEGGEIVAFLRDISARKKTETQLRKSERRFRRLFENASMGIAVHRLVYDSSDKPVDYIITDVNPAFFKILNFEPEKVLGKKATEAYGTEQAPFLDIYAPVAQGAGANQFDTYFPPMKKHFRVVAYSPAGDEFVTIFSDITEQKESRARIEESEERFRAIFEQAAVGVCLVGLDGRFLMVNERLCQMWKYSEEELLSSNFRDITHPDDQHIGEDLIGKLVSGERLSGNIEKRYIAKDGGVIHCSLTTRLVLDSDNEPKHFITVVEDVTGHKRAAEERERLQHQLQQSQKMDALGTLASGIAHDFNNILAAIMGYADLALDEVPVDSQVRQDLAAITKSASKARTLVRQILTYSRAVEGQKLPLSINKVIKEARVILSRTLPKMINMKFDLQKNLNTVKADPQHMEQVIINLVTNAVDAIQASGTVTIATRNITMDHQSCQACDEKLTGNYVLITVRDDGMGMTPEVRTKIFEPFYTTKGVGKGTGLGLSMVYGIVTGHGGHLCCQSNPGRGTKFFIYLPAVNEREAGLEPDGTVHKGDFKGSGTILVVDDEASVRDIAARIITPNGYKVLTANSGEEALDIYSNKQDDIDLIILDLGMPGMGGRLVWQNSCAWIPA
jgi:two-component system cell cycle sensor histidine kinase/response regulator CckA